MERSQTAIKKPNVKTGDRFGRLVVLERIMKQKRHETKKT